MVSEAKLLEEQNQRAKPNPEKEHTSEEAKDALEKKEGTTTEARR